MSLTHDQRHAVVQIRQEIFAVHFGLHLKKVGLISAEQLVAALEVQLHTLVPIGQLALEEGVLSAREIFDILQAQNDAPNERFGDLAIEMGLMKRDDLMRLLMIQADRKRPIAEILVAQGAITQEALENELAAFRRFKSRPQRMVALATRAPSLPRQNQPPMTSDEFITV